MAQTLNALDLLRRDHKHLEGLLHRFEKTRGDDEQRELCEQIVSGLKLHTEIEEQVFYPYLREATAREDLFQEATIEHDLAKELLEQLPKEQPGTPRMMAMMKVLADQVHHHVQEEETEIFPQIEETGVDLKALGEALQDCREQRMSGNGAAAVAGTDRRGEREQHREAGRGAHDAAHTPHKVDDREARKNETGGKGEAPGRAAAHEGPTRGKAGERQKAPGKGEAHPTALRKGDREQADDDRRFIEEHGGELSRSTQHAKWIHKPGEKPDRDGQTLATRSLEVIRAWAEARGGRPATTPGGDAEHPRVLRFDFPDYDKSLQPVSWEAWGSTFADRDLVFLYQEKMAAGNQSNFFRLDSPEREEG